MACWIRGCTTKGKKNAEKRSLFNALMEKFNNWRDNGIIAKGNKEFTQKSRICQLHFER